MKLSRRNSVLMLAAAAAFPAGVRAQAFPTKPIKVIVPYAPGGGATIITRALAKPLGEALGTTVVVENKGGGSTKQGTMEVMNAAPDGYTLVMNPPLAWVGYYYSKTYDEKPWESLTPIAQFAETPYNFVHTRVGSGLDTWAKVVAKAKANPGTVTGAGPAAGGLVEFAFNQMMERAGVTGKYVPFKGAQPATTALLGGHVDFQITTLGDGITAVRNGQTHGLGVSSEGRYPAAPDIPTFAELNMADTLMNTFSFWGPKGMDPKIVDTIATAVEKAAKDKEFIEVAENKMAYRVGFKPGPEIAQEIKAFDARWGKELAASFKDSSLNLRRASTPA